MRRLTLSAVLASCSLALACGGAEPPPPELPPPPPPAPVASIAPAPEPAPAPPPEPTAEEKKKAADLKALQDDKAKWEAEYKLEVARWTPELHAKAKLLAKPYPSLKAALAAAMVGPQRAPHSAERDRYRHPVETLSFFGVTPTSTVLEVGPGEGWYTELLAPVLMAKGQLFDTNGDPNGPPDSRGAFYAKRFMAFLDKAPEVFGKVKTVTIDGKAPKLDALPANSVDVVVVARAIHGMVNGGTLGAWLGEWHKVLKPNGVLGIEQHRAPEGADPVASAKKGYVPEKWLVDQAAAAGFKLAGKSEVNANPKDTKDYAEGVWTLPPTLELGDKDKEKYMAIGESDRMTLKFTKVPDKK